MAFNPFSGDPLTPLDGSLEERSSRCLNGRVGCTINCIPFGPRVFCQVLINSRKTGIGSRARSARTRVDEIVERRWLAARALPAPRTDTPRCGIIMRVTNLDVRDSRGRHTRPNAIRDILCNFSWSDRVSMRVPTRVSRNQCIQGQIDRCHCLFWKRSFHRWEALVPRRYSNTRRQKWERCVARCVRG